MIISTMYIVIWLVICPVCGWKYEQTVESYIGNAPVDVNLVECANSNCPIALWAKPIKIEKVETVANEHQKSDIYFETHEVKTVIYDSQKQTMNPELLSENRARGK